MKSDLHRPILADASPSQTASSVPPASPPSLVHRLDSIVEPINLAQLFAQPQPLEIELGSGDGSFLVAYARAHPARNFIGVERLLGRLRKVDRKGRRAGLANLRLIRLEASYLLEYLIPPGTVQALHVYFPDPWPKRRHQPNRLINARFTELAQRVLAPDGNVYLRTDDTPYFTQMTAVFQANPAFAAVATPPELTAITTDFERDFLQRGVLTQGTAYRLRTQ